MSAIITYTGKRFDAANPKEELLDIRDIAHALSMICRGGGHVHNFFSVAQHCLMCEREAAARGYNGRLRLACLIHDGAEAYMSDLPRPFKSLLPTYIEAEERLLSMIYVHFLGSDLTKKEAALVKAVDDDLLWLDLTVLLKDEVKGETPDFYSEPDYREESFGQVEKQYLDTFYDLYDQGK